MRIAVVTETYPPEVNGVARTMGQVVEGLLARGHKVELTRPTRLAGRRDGVCAGERLTEHFVKGVPIPRYSELQIGFASPASLAKRWRAARPDVVHVVTEGPLGWSAVIAARRLRIPISSGFHTNFHAYSRHYGFGLFAGVVGRTLRTLHNLCDATLVPTEEMRKVLATRGFERLAVVGRGIDLGLFNPGRRSTALRAQWRCAGDEPVVLHVGRIAPEKNLPLFVEAALAVRQIRPDARVVLVGDGPDAVALHAAHPDFIFAGTRRGADLAAHYASADLFLFPSVTETFGNVTTEALASGLAVVAYDYAAAHQHIVDGESGLLAPLGDAEGFVAAACTLARSVQTAVRLKRNAVIIAGRLGWPKVIDDMERVLAGVVAHPRRTPAAPAQDPAELPKRENA